MQQFSALLLLVLATTAARKLRLLRSLLAPSAATLARLAAIQLLVLHVTVLWLLSNFTQDKALKRLEDIVHKQVQYLFLYIEHYGEQDKNSLVLHLLRKRKPQMDGKMSRLRGVEHYGRRNRSDRQTLLLRYICRETFLQTHSPVRSPDHLGRQDIIEQQ